MNKFQYRKWKINNYSMVKSWPFWLDISRISRILSGSIVLFTSFSGIQWCFQLSKTSVVLNKYTYKLLVVKFSKMFLTSEHVTFKQKDDPRMSLQRRKSFFGSIYLIRTQNITYSFIFFENHAHFAFFRHFQIF